MRKLLVLSMLMICAISNAAALKSPVSLDWELTGSGRGEYECCFTLKNESADNLSDNWNIYFNMFPRKVTVSENSRVSIVMQQTGYYRMTPKKGFRLSAGEKCKLKFKVRGSLPNMAYTPDGGHFAFVGGKSLPLEIKHQPIRQDAVRKLANYPSAERTFAFNEEINPKNKPAFDEFDVLPAVKSVDRGDKSMKLPSGFTIVAGDALKGEAEYAEYLLKKKTTGLSGGKIGLSLALIARDKADNSVAESNDEYYELTVAENQWSIKGVSRDAVLNGIKTVAKLIDRNRNRGSIHEAFVVDWPDLHYRGMMLDVARNFSKADDIKRLVDKLAEYKINMLHFHFSDDEGWRLEIPGLPELTEVGARRGMTDDESDFMCQFYAGNGNPDDLSTTSNGYVSRREFIDLLKYAWQRGVKIIPEIESPGHARAIIVSMKARYNRLKNTDSAAAEYYKVWDSDDKSEYTSVQGYHDNVLNVAQEGVYRFFDKVADELISMYKEAGVELPYIHVGGDEVPKNPWTKSPDVQKLMADKVFKTTHDVEEYFITRVSDIISKKGVKIGGWQESAMRHSDATDSKLRPNVGGVYCWNTVPEWGADSIPYSVANNGYDVILCNVGNFYLDLAYNSHPMERGLNWGGYVNEFRTWDARPFDIYKSTFTTTDGRPLDLDDIEAGKPKLNAESRQRIKGVQAQLFSETIRNFDMVESYVFPKIFGLVERGWNAELLPGQTKALYNQKIGTTELPALKRDDYNFHIGLPGIKKENGMILMNAPYSEAEIRYTTDGSEPNADSKLWTRPIKSSGKMIKAKIFYLGKESFTTEFQNVKNDNVIINL